MNTKHAFLLGAAKSGSTSVASMLASHPQVLLSSPKEPVFFELEYQNDVKHYEQAFFPTLRYETVALDARPLNLYLPFVPARIAEIFPAARLVVVLRNPTDRAFSHWTHRWQRWRDRIPVGTFDQEVALDLQRMAEGRDFWGPDGPQLWRDELVLGGGRVRHKSPLLLSMGHYVEQLPEYLRLFRPSQVHIMFINEISEPSCVKALLNFLGVVDIPLRPRRSNPTQMAHRPGRLGDMTAAVQRMEICNLLPASAKQKLKAIVSDTSEIRLAPPARAALDEHFAPYNARLEELLGRSLPSDWAR